MDCHSPCSSSPLLQKCPELGCEFQSHFAYSLLCHKIIHDSLKAINPDLANILRASNFGILEQDPANFKLPGEVERSYSPGYDTDDESLGDYDDSPDERDLPHCIRSTERFSDINEGSKSPPKKRGRKPKQINPGDTNTNARSTLYSNLNHVKGTTGRKRGRPKSINNISSSATTTTSSSSGSVESLNLCSVLPKIEPMYEQKYSPTPTRRRSSVQSDTFRSEIRTSFTDSAGEISGIKCESDSTTEIELPHGVHVLGTATRKELCSSDSFKLNGMSQTRFPPKSYRKRRRENYSPMKAFALANNLYSPKSDPRNKQQKIDSKYVECQPFSSFDLTKLTAHDITNRSKKGKYEFVCIICKKFMKFRHHFIYHAISHTGEKPFTCKFCNKQYTQHHSLTFHLSKSHVEEVEASLVPVPKRETVSDSDQ